MMNDETPVVAVVVGSEAAPKQKRKAKTAAPAKKAVAKKKVKAGKQQKAHAKAVKKTAKLAIRKPAKKERAKRQAFPYLKVLKLWRKGKTIEEIARATGRYQKNAADPLHSFRVSLTRFHAGVRLNGELVRLPHRVSKKALRLATRAGKKAIG